MAIIGPARERRPGRARLGPVAGLAVGQDISERVLQMAATPPQFSLGKSFPRFGPVGPWLVTLDELANPADLELGCLVNGEQMQKGRTRDLIFGVPELIEQLSRVTALLPGDVIFTGTPSGVGLGRRPAALARPRRRPDQLHRGHRRDAAPLRRGIWMRKHRVRKHRMRKRQ